MDDEQESISQVGIKKKEPALRFKATRRFVTCYTFCEVSPRMLRLAFV